MLSQTQRTDAVTASQNPKITAASPTLLGSLRELGLCSKRNNVATVKMKAMGVRPIFQKLLRREFSMLPDRKSGHSTESISDQCAGQPSLFQPRWAVYSRKKMPLPWRLRPYLPSNWFAIRRKLFA
jgi:hypothetical protein